jgi:hypothetical protein
MDDKQATNIAGLIEFDTVIYGDDDDRDSSLDTIVERIPATYYMYKLLYADEDWYLNVKIKGKRR